MTEIEKLIWATAFAKAYERQHWVTTMVPGQTPGTCGTMMHDSRDVDLIIGYDCAEIADMAVIKYREAMDVDTPKLLINENKHKEDPKNLWDHVIDPEVAVRSTEPKFRSPEERKRWNEAFERSQKAEPTWDFSDHCEVADKAVAIARYKEGG